jgi:hypothetical protein
VTGMVGEVGEGLKEVNEVVIEAFCRPYYVLGRSRYDSKRYDLECK